MLTLENGSKLLALYDEMAQAARANDWNRLAALGTDADVVRKAASGDIRPMNTLTPQDQEKLAMTIRRILDLEREIREHAEPALESTRKLLSTSVRGRNVRDAYGSAGF